MCIVPFPLLLHSRTGITGFLSERKRKLKVKLTTLVIDSIHDDDDDAWAAVLVSAYLIGSLLPRLTGF